MEKSIIIMLFILLIVFITVSCRNHEPDAVTELNQPAIMPPYSRIADQIATTDTKLETITISSTEYVAVPSNKKDKFGDEFLLEETKLYDNGSYSNGSYSNGSYSNGSYRVGEELPAGIYMALDDGTIESTVMVKDDADKKDDTDKIEEKPKIIITARYETDRSKFSGRQAYIEAIHRGGGIPVHPDDEVQLAEMIRNGDSENADLLAEKYDGLLLPGGEDIAAHFFGQESHPASGSPDELLDSAELELCRAFLRVNKPVLGICRGMQVLNVATGGVLIQDIPSLLDLPNDVHNNSAARHEIDIESGTWLYQLFGNQIKTNSTHHQCVDGVAEGFTAVARAGPVIEAMERGNAFGVQFHPERMLDEGMLPLFEDFITRCLPGE